MVEHIRMTKRELSRGGSLTRMPRGVRAHPRIRRRRTGKHKLLSHRAKLRGGDEGAAEAATLRGCCRQTNDGVMLPSSSGGD
jgi:hypothetical protein